MTTAREATESAGARARIEERRERVAELLLSGFSLRTIARRLGVGITTVHRDSVVIRKRWRRDCSHNYDLLVAKQEARLDQLERTIARPLAEGDLAAVDRALKILDRRARLLGLDAPQKHEVTVEDPISAEIRRLAEEIGVLDSPAVRRALGLEPTGPTSPQSPTIDTD